MKRYIFKGYKDEYYSAREVTALLAEKDSEIVRLDAGWLEANVRSLDYAERLRASNEALVAAEARVKEVIDDFLDWAEQAENDELGDFGASMRESVCLYHDNLTALRQHDKEVRAKEREACAKLCDGLHHTWRWDNAPDSTSGPRDCASSIRARPDAEVCKD